MKTISPIQCAFLIITLLTSQLGNAVVPITVMSECTMEMSSSHGQSTKMSMSRAMHDSNDNDVTNPMSAPYSAHASSDTHQGAVDADSHAVKLANSSVDNDNANCCEMSDAASCCNTECQCSSVIASAYLFSKNTIKTAANSPNKVLVYLKAAVLPPFLYQPKRPPIILFS